MTSNGARKLFGTDGIRAVAGEAPLDPTTIYCVGLALAHSLRKTTAQPKVLVGRDTRESGPWIAATLAAGLRKAGALVESAGVVHHSGGCISRADARVSGGRRHLRFAQSLARQRHQALRRRWVQVSRCGRDRHGRGDPSPRRADENLRSAQLRASRGQSCAFKPTTFTSSSIASRAFPSPV